MTSERPPVRPRRRPALLALAGAFALALLADSADAQGIFSRMKQRPTPVAFTPEQQETLGRISNYFNSIRTMQGQFLQFGPDGEQAEGVFYLARPGRVRFEYRPPVRLEVVSNGSTVAVIDRKVNTQDMYPLSQTPLRHLLADRIDLASSSIVQDVREEPDLISLVITEDSTFGDGYLTMTFDRASYELRQWVVTDAQGLDTTFIIQDVAAGEPVDPGKFRIYAHQPR